MSCMNEETIFTAGVPEDVKALRKKLIAMLQGNVGARATPLEGKLTAGPDPMQLAANNTIMKMMGYGGYTYPGTAGTVPGTPGPWVPGRDDIPQPGGDGWRAPLTPGPIGTDQPSVRTSGPSGIPQRSGGLDPYSPQGRLLMAMLNQQRGQ